MLLPFRLPQFTDLFAAFKPAEIFYIGGPIPLPAPLTPEEERALLLCLPQEGERVRRTLIEHNLRLVAHIIRKKYAGARDQEDLVSIGTIGLIKAVDTFDGTKGPRLVTYASRCIENEILMHFRGLKKTERDVSLSEPIDADGEGHPLTLMDVLAQEDTMADDLERRTALMRLGDYINECL